MSLGHLLGGIKLNGAGSATITQAVNETNEITTIDRPSPAPAAAVITEPFTTSLSSIWTQDKGTWSISSNQVNVDTLAIGEASLRGSPDHLGVHNHMVRVTPPVARVVLASFGPGRGPDAGVVPALPVTGRSRSLRSPPPSPRWAMLDWGNWPTDTCRRMLPGS